MKKKVLSLVMTTVLAFTFSFNGLFNESVKVSAIESKTKHSNGYKAPELKIIRSSEKPMLKSSIYPSTYDSRDFGYTTAVKDQGQIGDCWAFTTYGVLDTNQKKLTNKEYDFSEINLAENNGLVGADDGGNMYYSISYFMKGKGPVLEKDDPYPNPAIVSNINSNPNAPVNYTVDDVTLLPDRTSSYDNDYIKENVMKYGGVYTSIYLEGYNYDIIKDNKYLYVPEGMYSYPNHAVVIVGWDDNFPKENFPNLPSGNGAFICKNSWGEGFGDNGYIYVSYYDTIVGTDSAVIPTLTKKSQYDKRNSYGDNFPMYAIGTNYEGSYAASTYTASENQYVNSIGVFSNEQDITYDLYIEEDYGTNKFTNILNKRVKTIKIHDAGFHTIKLDTPVKISAGKTYAVAFKNNAKGLFVEPDTVAYPYENNNFIKLGGQSWMSGYDGVFIVANTTKVPQYPITGISLDKSNLSLGYNGKYKLSAAIMPQNADNKTIYWTSNNPSVATVDEDGNVTGMRNGSAVITAATIDGKVKATSNVTVSNALTVLSFAGPQESTVINSNSVWTLTFNDKVLAGPGYNSMYLVDSKGIKAPLSPTIIYNKATLKADMSNMNGGLVKLVIPKDAFIDIANGTIGAQIEKQYYASYKSGQKVNFKDSNFEQFIRDNLGKHSGDIYSEDMARLTQLSIYNTPIWSLSGIEYATNLKTLDIEGSELIDIYPISTLYSLEKLTLANNNVNSVTSLSSLPNLNYLSLIGENVKDFSSLVSIKKLEDLNISNGKVSDIKFLSTMSNLKYLSLYRNFISDITPITNLKRLSRIDLTFNEIKDISPLLQRPSRDEYYKLFGEYLDGYIYLGGNVVFNSNDLTSPSIKQFLQTNWWEVYSDYPPKENLYLRSVNGAYYLEYGVHELDRVNGVTLTFNSNIQKGISFEDIRLKNSNDNSVVPIDKSISGNKLIIKPVETLDSDTQYIFEIPDNAVIDSSQNNLKATSVNLKTPTYLKGDSNGDGKIDTLDLATVASHYDEMASSSAVKWDLKKDWNRDGIIDIFDITTVAKHIQ